MILWVSISNLVSSWTNLSVSYRERNSGMQTQIKVVMSCQKWKETKSSNSGTWEQWQGFIFCLLSAEVTTSRRKYYCQKVWLLSKQLVANSNPLNDNGDQAGNISIIFLGNWLVLQGLHLIIWEDDDGKLLHLSHSKHPISQLGLSQQLQLHFKIQAVTFSFLTIITLRTHGCFYENICNFRTIWLLYSKVNSFKSSSVLVASGALSH